jgi:protein NrfC
MDSTAKFPRSEGQIVAEPEKCAGCQVCMLVCSLVHEGECNTQLARIQVAQEPYQPWPECIKIKPCRQCPSPACVKACPTGACYVDTEHGNVRTIDESKCTGCQACLEACPFDRSGIVWNPDRSVASKCDLCSNAPYLGEPGGPGGKQACVAYCPQQCLKYRPAAKSVASAPV